MATKVVGTVEAKVGGPDDGEVTMTLWQGDNGGYALEIAHVGHGDDGMHTTFILSGVPVAKLAALLGSQT